MWNPGSGFLVSLCLISFLFLQYISDNGVVAVARIYQPIVGFASLPSGRITLRSRAASGQGWVVRKYQGSLDKVQWRGCTKAASGEHHLGLLSPCVPEQPLVKASLRYNSTPSTSLLCLAFQSSLWTRWISRTEMHTWTYSPSQLDWGVTVLEFILCLSPN